MPAELDDESDIRAAVEEEEEEDDAAAKAKAEKQKKTPSNDKPPAPDSTTAKEEKELEEEENKDKEKKKVTFKEEVDEDSKTDAGDEKKSEGDDKPAQSTQAEGSAGSITGTLRIDEDSAAWVAAFVEKNFKQGINMKAAVENVTTLLDGTATVEAKNDAVRALSGTYGEFNLATLADQYEHYRVRRSGVPTTEDADTPERGIFYSPGSKQMVRGSANAKYEVTPSKWVDKSVFDTLIEGEASLPKNPSKHGGLMPDAKAEFSKLAKADGVKKPNLRIPKIGPDGKIVPDVFRWKEVMHSERKAICDAVNEEKKPGDALLEWTELKQNGVLDVDQLAMLRRLRMKYKVKRDSIGVFSNLQGIVTQAANGTKISKNERATTYRIDPRDDTDKAVPGFIGHVEKAFDTVRTSKERTDEIHKLLGSLGMTGSTAYSANLFSLCAIVRMLGASLGVYHTTDSLTLSQLSHNKELRVTALNVQSKKEVPVNASVTWIGLESEIQSEDREMVSLLAHILASFDCQLVTNVIQPDRDIAAVYLPGFANGKLSHLCLKLAAKIMSIYEEAGHGPLALMAFIAGLHCGLTVNAHTKEGSIYRQMLRSMHFDRSFGVILNSDSHKQMEFVRRYTELGPLTRNAVIQTALISAGLVQATDPLTFVSIDQFDHKSRWLPSIFADVTVGYRKASGNAVSKKAEAKEQVKRDFKGFITMGYRDQACNYAYALASVFHVCGSIQMAVDAIGTAWRVYLNNENRTRLHLIPVFNLYSWLEPTGVIDFYLPLRAFRCGYGPIAFRQITLESKGTPFDVPQALHVNSNAEPKTVCQTVVSFGSVRQIMLIQALSLGDAGRKILNRMKLRVNPNDVHSFAVGDLDVSDRPVNRILWRSRESAPIAGGCGNCLGATGTLSVVLPDPDPHSEDIDEIGERKDSCYIDFVNHRGSLQETKVRMQCSPLCFYDDPVKYGTRDPTMTNTISHDIVGDALLRHYNASKNIMKGNMNNRRNVERNMKLSQPVIKHYSANISRVVTPVTKPAIEAPLQEASEARAVAYSGKPNITASNVRPAADMGVPHTSRLALMAGSSKSQVGSAGRAGPPARNDHSTASSGTAPNVTTV